jgi:N-acetylmuramoyl-L-alanine amidase
MVMPARQSRLVSWPIEEEPMRLRLRRGAVATSAGTLALVVLGGPILAGPAYAAGPMVVVHPGDTLAAIAARYGTTVARRVALNQIRNPDLILPGQVVVLTPPSGNGTAGTSAPGALVFHVVRPGENLTRLGASYGTSIAAIVRANGLANPNWIEIGQRLRIPVAASASTSRPGSSASLSSPYVVRAGETLTGIARRYSTTVEVLVRLNHLPRANFIWVGQRILVPAVPAGSDPQTGWSIARFPAATRALMAHRAVIRDLIADEARRAGVPVPLALAVAWQESGWRQRVVSSAGAVGVMQLLPSTARWVADSMLHAPIDIHSPRSNVRGGVALLKHYLLRYRGDLRRALAAYYQGQGAVDHHGIFPVSRPYIASILLLEELLQP